MYMDRVLEVSKATNGFVVSCYAPIKPDKNNKDCIDCNRNKQYLAKDIEEVKATIEKLLPMMDMEFKSESEFDKAFESAASATESA